jgi:preprotein translocase subunit SecD
MLDFPRWKIISVIVICLWGIYLAIPNFIPENVREEYSSVISQNTIKLGLDLQGGSHLLLEVGFEEYLKEYKASIMDDLRRSFNKERIGYRDLRLVDNDPENGLYIKFTPRVLDTSQYQYNVENINEAIKSTSSDLMTEVEESGAYRVFFSESYVTQLKRDVLQKSIEIVRKRVDETGTREPIIQMQGEERILLQVPGLEDPESLKRLLGKTAKMTFHLMDDNDPFAVQTRKARPGTLLLSDIDPESTQLYLVEKRVEIGGDQLIDAQPTYDRGSPVVSFRFNNFGAKKFAKITRENVNKPFAVVLDGKVVTAPRINQPILGGSGIITGGFSTQEATELAILLRSGALPAPLTVIEERTVGPSLGADSIESGKKASIISVILVILMMAILYKKFGLISDLALVVNLILLIAILSLFGATLTLPGIAGIVLTMGMAVDANVLIFERIKEEIKVGKTPFAAVDHGFKAAFKTILDSNITTLIATFILFSYGSGPVKGFAVTLSAGILCSMFTAILFTRMLVVLWLKKNKPKTLKI